MCLDFFTCFLLVNFLVNKLKILELNVGKSFKLTFIFINTLYKRNNNNNEKLRKCLFKTYFRNE